MSCQKEFSLAGDEEMRERERERDEELQGGFLDLQYIFSLSTGAQVCRPWIFTPRVS